jgi:hypothetical protein
MITRSIGPTIVAKFKMLENLLAFLGANSMENDYDRNSFKHDPQAKSFQLTGFSWSQLPVLLVTLFVCVCLLTGFNLVAATGLSFLNRDALLVLTGLSIGYLIGVWVGARMNCGLGKNSMSLEDAPPLSESIKVLADDPRRKIEAVKAYKLETGVDLAMAKRVVEDYIDRDRTAS